jgi:transposase
MPAACTVPRCERPQRGGHGLCGAHNHRRSRGKPLDTPLREYKRKGCSVAGCTRPHTAKGYCFFHWRHDRYGTPQRRQRTPDERAAIQRLYAAEVSITEIARRFDCSRNTVRRIIQGKTFQST